MKKHIPNVITSCNLIAGCIAVYYAFRFDYSAALLFIIIGALFDFFDGFSARLLGVSSPIGKELDSLADDITFGFAPAAIVYAMMTQIANGVSCTTCSLAACGLTDYLPYAAFLIAAFSALRLAKFNLDTRQTTSFIGLPTPANALFWGSLALSLSEAGLLDGSRRWLTPLLLAGILLSCWILIAEIPMFALKFKTFKWGDNKLRYSFILASLLLLLLLGWAGFSAIIVLYVFTSLLNNHFGTDVVKEEDR